MNKKTIIISSIILVILAIASIAIIITTNKSTDLYEGDLSEFENSVWMDEEDRCGVDNTGLCMVTCKGNFNIHYPEDDKRCEQMIGIKGLKCCILN